jgi:hypothetical protein
MGRHLGPMADRSLSKSLMSRLPAHEVLVRDAFLQDMSGRREPSPDHLCLSKDRLGLILGTTGPGRGAARLGTLDSALTCPRDGINCPNVGFSPNAIAVHPAIAADAEDRQFHIPSRELPRVHARSVVDRMR